MTSWIERKCTERGLRMTDQRKVIAKVLSEANDHPDAEDLYSRASTIDPKISLATVYRTVRLFLRQALLRPMTLEMVVLVMKRLMTTITITLLM